MDEDTRRKVREAAGCFGYSQGQYLLKALRLLPKWMAIHGKDSVERFFDEYKKSPEKVEKEIARFDVRFPPVDPSKN